MSDINELREHLFATLRGLKDGSINEAMTFWEPQPVQLVIAA